MATGAAPAAAVAVEYLVGTINRVGAEDLGGDGFSGTSHFVGPADRSVGEVASDKETERVVRAPDPAEPREVRDRRRFHRDRAPGAYAPLTAP
ncbi:hydrolase [Streptomyces sp. NWU49]|nr:hydrolase [Streptomyces sp. NWU49]